MWRAGRSTLFYGAPSPRQEGPQAITFGRLPPRHFPPPSGGGQGRGLTPYRTSGGSCSHPHPNSPTPGPAPGGGPGEARAWVRNHPEVRVSALRRRPNPAFLHTPSSPARDGSGSDRLCRLAPGPQLGGRRGREDVNPLLDGASPAPARKRRGAQFCALSSRDNSGCGSSRAESRSGTPARSPEFSGSRKAPSSSQGLRMGFLGFGPFPQLVFRGHQPTPSTPSNARSPAP